MKQSDVQIWLETQAALKQFVNKRVNDQALAEDIVQDVFLKVHASIDSLNESEKLTHWMYQITRNMIIDHFRRQSKSVEIEQIDWKEDVANYNECVSHCIKDMVKKLPEKYRQAIELTEFENLSQLQLAEHLQISYSGAKSRVQRARQILREEMNKAYTIQFDPYGNAIVCKDRLPCGCD